VVPLQHGGVEIIGFFPTVGARAADTAHLRFDLELPSTALIGPAGGGMLLLTQCLGYERLSAAVQLLAGSKFALRLAKAHLRSREQFEGRLFDKQALRHRLVDCWVQLAAAEAFLKSVVTRMVDGQARTYETAALKLHCARLAGHISDESLQFFGGRGYTSNFPLERFWRDARLARIGGGSDEVMREIVGSALDSPDPEIELILGQLSAADSAIATDEKENLSIKDSEG
jgi:alkylation response protein AidB-like acyl-CoA dehydrogenase